MVLFLPSLGKLPHFNRLFYNLGNPYYVLQQYEDALKDLSQAIDLAPDYAVPYHYRGQTYTALGQNEQALADYTQAISLDYAKSHYNLAKLYEEQSDSAQAMTHFEQYLALDSQEVLAKEAILFRLTRIPLGGYREAAEEHLADLQAKTN